MIRIAGVQTTTVLLVLFVCCGVAAGSSQSVEAVGSTPSGPLCGINCVYTALRAQGYQVAFAQLLKPRYVSSKSGSTMQELSVAAREQGAYSEALTNLSTSDLHHLNCPAILHVKNGYDAPEYDHYVLCVPTSDGRLAVYDPPDPLVRTDGHELAALWDGTALLVSARPIDLSGLRLRAALLFALTAALVLAGLSVPIWLRRLRTSRTSQESSPVALPVQCGLLVLSSLAVASGYHLISPEGFRAQRPAVAGIVASHFPEPPGSVDLNEARALWGRRARFIDARDPADYDAGHIAGAINIPANVSRADRARALADVVKDAPIVVYCQSPACPYAALLSNRLAAEGFTAVKVYVGGWEQWKDATGTARETLARTEDPR